MTDKLCVFCKWLSMQRIRVDDFADVFEPTCDQEYWMLNGEDDAPEFRAYIKKAVDCPDYEAVE